MTDIGGFFRLDGKVALVTGGYGGIGSAGCSGLGAAGAGGAVGGGGGGQGARGAGRARARDAPPTGRGQARARFATEGARRRQPYSMRSPRRIHDGWWTKW